MCDQTTTGALKVQDIAIGDKIRAESTDPTYSVEGTVAEVGGCFIVLDGIGDELDEALHTFSRPPAADQTPATEPSAHYCGVHGDLLAAPRSARCAEAPVGHEYTPAPQTRATDSERDEGRNAATLRLLASIERLGAETQAEDYLAEEVRHLLALLAEQAATIERVRVLHHPEPVFAFDAECGHDDEEHVTFEGRDGGTLCQDTPTGHACTDCRDELGDPVDWPCLTVRALGSQRTEGQG